MTEMTSVGSDRGLEMTCLCQSTPVEVNSILELDKKESQQDGCLCHNPS